jgi:hypothetical protein
MSLLFLLVTPFSDEEGGAAADWRPGARQIVDVDQDVRPVGPDLRPSSLRTGLLLALCSFSRSFFLLCALGLVGAQVRFVAKKAAAALSGVSSFFCVKMAASKSGRNTISSLRVLYTNHDVCEPTNSFVSWVRTNINMAHVVCDVVHHRLDDGFVPQQAGVGFVSNGAHKVKIRRILLELCWNWIQRVPGWRDGEQRYSPQARGGAIKGTIDQWNFRHVPALITFPPKGKTVKTAGFELCLNLCFLWPLRE